MEPDFKITIGGKDKTAAIRERLIRLSITDEAGHKSDSLVLELNDDGRLDFPAKEQNILVWTGYKDPLTGQSDLVFRGNYQLDGVEFPFPDSKMIISASGARLRGSFTSPRDDVWIESSLGDIAETIAKRHGFELAISESLKGVEVFFEDQKAQSDADLLTRLATRYNATLKPVGDKLVLFERGDGKSVSGKPVKPVAVPITEETRGNVRLSGRVRQKSVRANYRNLDAAKQLFVETSDEQPQKVLDQVFDFEADARQAAFAELHDIQRQQFEFIMNRMPANPALRAEAMVTISGHPRRQANGEWVIKRLTETLDNQGLWQGFTASYPKGRVKGLPDPQG
ncbi:contractile injection system protein, VgrG/Pvc8 family [Endozoicomonas gorgoniicola]|uniref:Contractile injection system protein, VgrG/Pvc8 family n=1 Tax=Endozoicomonas gorgoniicola TaxID=1234144 RepID=A0ABT3MW81_9GAMM|nr:contractile injection system protein, VgrG/Pvc8 family [Endozoicomonas gorgoniicola]MCW7553639.1 contractile injection system protein, VgrG/Pvc8 family [Endozoicomonas gorgoniicola]